MAVTLIVGANSNDNLDLAGRTIGELKNDEALAGVFSIESDYNVEVSDSEDGDFVPVDDYHEIEDGDVVRFSKPAGEKG